jgi:hypothetical protein
MAVCEAHPDQPFLTARRRECIARTAIRRSGFTAKTTSAASRNDLAAEPHGVSN